MYVLKRIAAYLIDLALVTTLVSSGGIFLLGRLQPQAAARPDEVPVAPQTLPHPRAMPFGLPAMMTHGASGLGLWALSVAGPVLILGTLTGLTGRTPGKLLLFLRVQDAGGDPPGLANGIVREVVKAVSLAFFLGMLYALQGILTGRQSFYDKWLDLEVDDLRPGGLTPTQKKFRKYMREQAKRQRQGK